MKDLLSIAGMTKQGFWKHNRREQEKQAISETVIAIINQKRQAHRRMGCRSIYYSCSSPVPVGRDIFEKIGYSNGFKLHKKPNLVRTTWGQKVLIHPNLIEGKTLTGINQVWQSDIFYINIEGKHHYGFTIEDVYSRRLLALHIAKRLKADELAKALKQAIAERKGTDLNGCIVHSDRGSQYIGAKIGTLLNEYNMIPSMCKLPQENSYVERVQGTIKNQYLCEFEMKENNLRAQAKKVLHLYNFEKPHSGLSNYPPAIFEQIVEKMPQDERPKEQVFKWIDPLSTKNQLINKKEKRSKKEKIQYNRSYLYS
jgi:hypothetical protein